jgi:two-component system NarL family response regulator
MKHDTRTPVAAPIRIMVVDDHPIVREGFGGMIATEPDMCVVAEASSGEDAIRLFRTHRPDVTLLDLRMPGMDGVETMRAILQEFPRGRIIVLTTYDGDEDIYRALQGGAWAYLLKDMLIDEILAAIRAVHSGHRRIPAAVGKRLAERISGTALSARELDVLQLLGQGKSNRDVADRLAITEATVKGHVTNILSKLGVTDRTQAVLIALKRGLVHL